MEGYSVFKEIRLMIAPLHASVSMLRATLPISSVIMCYLSTPSCPILLWKNPHIFEDFYICDKQISKLSVSD